MERGQPGGDVFVPPAPPRPVLSEVLHGVALAVTASLDIRQTLERLACLTLEAIPANRCTLFLLDEPGRALVPTLSIGQNADDELWERFRSLDPIDLHEVPERWEGLCGGRGIAIEDTIASPLVPRQMVETFEARSLLLVPLAIAGDPIGLLAIDWTTVDRRVSEDELWLAEAIASYAALAIRNARLYEGQRTKARSLERLVEVAAALNSSSALAPVLDLVCGAFEELLHTTHCSVSLFGADDAAKVDTVALTGVALPDGVSPLDNLAAHELQQVTEQWQGGLQASSETDALWSQSQRAAALGEVRSVALFPLIHEDRTVGAVVVGFDTDRRPSSERMAIGRALAELAAAAIGRANVDRRLRLRLEHVETLTRLSDVVAGTTKLDPALRRLSHTLRVDLGVNLTAVALTDAVARAAVGARAPDDEELEAVRSWRAVLGRGRRPLRPREVPGGLLVPVARGRRVLGALRVTVRPGPSRTDDELLLAVGAGCADVVHQAGLHRDLADSERRLAVASERDRIAQDLHDSVAQLVTGIGMRVAQFLPEAPDHMWQERLEGLLELAGQGSREIREAIHHLLFLDVRRTGLASSIRELGKRFEATSGITTRVRVTGTVDPLSATREDVLFRVAHEALVNAERHSRAAVVRVALAYGDNGVTLTVRDDGVGLGHRDPFGAQRGHLGFRGLAQMVEEAGGVLAVGNAARRGVEVRAGVPRTGRVMIRGAGASRRR